MRGSDREELLRYYKDELIYLRNRGGHFARAYPMVAGQLGLGPGEASDPQVERLIESFAFLAARIQHELDGEFPEITTALLGNLYPQFVNPIPPMAIAQFHVDPDQGKLTTGHLIEKNTSLSARTEQGLVCRLRTCYPVTLWPLEVVYAGFESPAQFDFLDSATKVSAVLRLSLAPRGIKLQELELRKLRFYLNGDRMVVSKLYELLFGNVLSVAVLPEESARPVCLPADSISPVGFGLEDEVLPYPPNAHPGYRLLHEHFTFPEKFMFFEVDHLDRALKGECLDLLFMLDRPPGKDLCIDQTTFALGCTPIINLFRKTTEPIRLDHRQLEYPLIPDKRRERTTEIHSVISVTASSNTGEQIEVFEPFYSYDHHAEGADHKSFWHARRLPTGRKDLPGTEMQLSFLDLGFKPSLPPTQTVFAHTLCTNRDLAEQLPAGASLQTEARAPLCGISCLTRPTAPIPPPLRGATLWRLISQLSLNHLSLGEDPASLVALREILRLYCPSDHPSLLQQIEGVREISCRRIVSHIGSEAWRGFCRGIEVTVTFDEELYVGSSAFLLGSVLNHFFALYASVNCFTQLVIKSRQREGVWKRWPPMAGEKIVL